MHLIIVHSTQRSAIEIRALFMVSYGWHGSDARLDMNYLLSSHEWLFFFILG